MSATFLDPFNAKAMGIREVASTFVPSTKFRELAGHWNSVLLGPRGSGKTTLMKMLSVEGLRAWDAEEAREYRAAIKFSGVYVPSDIAWGEIVEAMTDGLESGLAERLSVAAFVTNVLKALVSTMQSRLAIPSEPIVPSDSAQSNPSFKLATCSPTALEHAINTIAEYWRLTPRSLSLEGLDTALGNRLLDIEQAAHRLRRGRAVEDRVEAFLDLPLAGLVSAATSAFDRAIGETSGQWALLLDEFEVAPLHLQRAVLTALRASSPNLLYKLALAPCGPHALMEVSSTATPYRDHDYKLVELWYVSREQADNFCEEIFQARKRTSWSALSTYESPRDVFGSSGLPIVGEDGLDSRAVQSYGRGAEWEREFKELIKKDSTFAAFLAKKRIDPENLDPSPTAPNGNTVRKIAPLVAFRNAYRGHTEGNKRGRKPYNSAYKGWEAICAMSEGNPRWLIGIINEIMAKHEPSGPPKKVPVTVQQEVTVGLSQAFAELLRTAATAQRGVAGQTAPVFETLEKIGKYFFDRLVLDSFVEDPPLSIVVDKETPTAVENALRLALNHGALVCYESADGLAGYSSLIGKRLRLAYLLAPTFKLPLRASKHTVLSTVLGQKNEALPKDPQSSSPQGSFTWD